MLENNRCELWLVDWGFIPTILGQSLGVVFLMYNPLVPFNQPIFKKLKNKLNGHLIT